MNIGDTVKVPKETHVGVKAKLETKRNEKGKIVEIYKNFVVVQYEKGYKECFRKEELKLC